MGEAGAEFDDGSAKEGVAAYLRAADRRERAAGTDGGAVLEAAIRNDFQTAALDGRAVGGAAGKDIQGDALADGEIAQRVTRADFQNAAVRQGREN